MTSSPLSAAALQNRLLSRTRFRHMQVLVALAELGSVRRAAEHVGMTQPGVTKLLAELEALLGTALFQRHARGVRPTPACAELLALAGQTLRGVQSAAAAVAARRTQGEGCVRVTGTTAAVNGVLAGALLRFSREQPGVQVQLKEAELEDVLLGLARGEVDLGACRRPPLVPEGWTFRELLPDRMVIVCAAVHPLAGKPGLGLRDLEHETWLPGPAGALSWRYLAACAEAFASPPRVCQVLTRVPTVIWWMLRDSHLLAIAPFSVVRQYVEAGELAVLEPDGAPPGVEQPMGVLVPAAGVPPATARLAAFLAEVAGGEG